MAVASRELLSAGTTAWEAVSQLKAESPPVAPVTLPRRLVGETDKLFARSCTQNLRIAGLEPLHSIESSAWIVFKQAIHASGVFAEADEKAINAKQLQRVAALLELQHSQAASTARLQRCQHEKSSRIKAQQKKQHVEELALRSKGLNPYEVHKYLGASQASFPILEILCPWLAAGADLSQASSGGAIRADKEETGISN